MINKIVFNDKIILYWEKDRLFKTGMQYLVSCNNDIFYTQKTHFSIDIPEGMKAAEIMVALTDENKKIIKEYEKARILLPRKKKKIDVTQAPYFAVGDGKTLNTDKIQQAIRDCGKDEAVYFPAGVYLSGALDIYDDTELYMDEGAVLQGTDNPCDYLPKIKSRFEGIERMCYRSLINIGTCDNSAGYSSKNIIIRGKQGAILGGGYELMRNIIERESEDENCNAYTRDAERTRGRLINISNAQNVIIYGLELGMSPAWNVHILYSDNVVTANCFIHSEGICNGDGWDPDSSTNCTIFNCDFRTRDDMIAIKSGKNPEGNVINRPSSEIRIFDCRSTMGHGIAMGSEISGGIHNVFIWDCDIELSRCGLEIKGTKKRGGYVKNIHVSRCRLPLIAIREVDYNDDGEACSSLPEFADFYFEDISVTGIYTLHTGERKRCAPLIINGFDEQHKVKNVVIKNVRIKNRGGKTNGMQNIEISHAENVSLENIYCD